MLSKLQNFNEVQRIHIVHFLGHLKEQGKSSRTLARHIASIRAFHQFLLREKVIGSRSAVHIETPKSGKNTSKSVKFGRSRNVA